MDFLKSAVNTVSDTVTNSNMLTGNAEKAYLLVRNGIMNEVDGNKTVNNLLNLANNLESKLDAITNAASLLTMNSEIYSQANERGYIPIKVQYNPSSITFSGLKGIQSPGHEGTHIEINRSVESVMGMELIFDTMQASRAFMMDKTAKDVVTGWFKTGKSVRQMVELLVAATVFPSTRWIGFAWNKMIFWGELVYVDATYTMFDTSGEPVRAKVAIQIRQDEVTVAKDIGDEKKTIESNIAKQEKQWKKQLTALGKKKPKMASSVSNILNTNF